MDDWIKHIKSSQAIAGEEILIPGEKEHYSQLKSEQEGVFLEPVVYEKLKDIESQYQLNTRI